MATWRRPLPTFVQVLVPAGERWNSALATPEPASAESEVTVKVPLIVADAAGAVTDPVGACCRRVRWRSVAEVKVVPTLSVVITRRS